MARLLSLLFLLLALSSCRSSGGGFQAPSGPLFTQYTLRIDDNNNTASTNYRSESFRIVPVNTEVSFVSGGRRMKMQVVGAMPFTFEHIQKHTKNSANAAFDLAFGAQPVDLSAFSEVERNAIEAGTLEIGMSREAVLVAMGPPPAVGTPSLDTNTWKYWSNRFRTFFVTFDETDHVSHTGQ